MEHTLKQVSLWRWPESSRKLIFTLVCCGFFQPIFSKDEIIGIQPYLQELTGYSFQQLESTRDLTRVPGDFPVQVLMEYTLRSYSRWTMYEQNNPETQLNVYEMLDQQGAYGMFQFKSAKRINHEGARIELPVENRCSEGECVFWRGPFFFHLVTKLGPQKRERLKRAMSKLTKTISLVNIHPITVQHLPRKNLISESIGFCLGAGTLQQNERFPSDLIEKVGFQDKVEIAFAKYKPDRGTLFLMAYPTPALATDYFLKLQNSLHSYFSKEGIYLKRSGLILALFLGNANQARAILENVQWTPSIRWIQDRTIPPLSRKNQAKTFLEMLTRTTLATICFVIGTLGGGCLLGFIWHWISQCYPKWSSRHNTIRLNLSLHNSVLKRTHSHHSRV